MALEGHLSDFNLAEILQLIAGQQKSGFLKLETQPQMVFIFHKGNLISTRDRRGEAPDSLERFLQNYGFLTAADWKNIDYFKQHSSLDLTEILLSEQIMTDEEINNLLRAVAVELTQLGMTLKRGSYHFTATQGTPPGVRGRITLDVQSLLMEAARRTDEETQLREYFPSLEVTFQPGAEDPDPTSFSDTARRIHELALEGFKLSDIIQQAQADSFVTRDQLKRLCQENFLQAMVPGAVNTDAQAATLSDADGIRHSWVSTAVLLAATVLLILGAGYVRWRPLWEPGCAPEAGRATPRISTAAFTVSGYSGAAQELRQAQLRDEVQAALQFFHHRHGKYPVDLSLLVEEGALATQTYRILILDGWTYRLSAKGDSYTLAG